MDKQIPQLVGKIHFDKETILAEVGKITSFISTLHEKFIPVVIISGLDFSGGEIKEHRICVDVDSGDILNDTKVKFECFRQIGVKLFEENIAPKMVSMATEAWLVIRKKEDLKNGVMPRDDPERQVVSSLTIDKKVAITYSPIIGRYDNETPKFGDFGEVLYSEDENQADLLKQVYIYYGI